MKARKTICSLLCALLPLGPLALAPTAAQAQHYTRDRMPAPDIRGFDVEEVRRIAPGVELHFNLYGTPGGNATVKIDGATRNLRLHEVDRGQYAGTYTIGTHDRIRNGSRVTADLRVGDRVASDVLRETLVRDGAPPVAQRNLASDGRSTNAPRAARYCTNCATVEAVNVVENRGSGALGAVGGAVVGRNIDQNAHRNQRYEVVVRYSGNGATQTLQYDNDPGFRAGDAVRVNDGVLSRDQ